MRWECRNMLSLLWHSSVICKSTKVFAQRKSYILQCCVSPTINIQHIARDLLTASAAREATVGNALLAQLMSLQDRTTDPADPSGHRGNFRFYVEHPATTDLNALSFCGIQLAYIALERADLLTPENSTELFGTTLPECLIGYDNHWRTKSGPQRGAVPTPRWWQCNIWCLNIAGRLMIARATGRDLHIDIARRQLADLRHYVAHFGIGEYNSPTYIPHQVLPLHWAWHYAPDAAFRSDAAWLLDAWYLDLAENYHAPSKTLGGTWSRHYEPDLTDHDKFRCLTDAMFELTEPSHLNALGLEDYSCPDWIRRIARSTQHYSSWRQNPETARRVMFHAPTFTLATQTGDFVWKQQDAPVVLTHTAEAGQPRVAVIRTPYWPADTHAARDYAWSFERHAHQFEHMAILSYRHTGGGNELLFNLGSCAILANSIGRPISAPVCPILPAVPNHDPSRAVNVHFTPSPDLAYTDPAAREIPGLPADGAVLADLDGCFVAVIPAKKLELRTAVMRGDAQIVIPVRPSALFAIIVLDKTTCPDVPTFAERIGTASLTEGPMASAANSATLSFEDTTLTAVRDKKTGRLSDRRVNERFLPWSGTLCWSPFHTRRPGDAGPLSRLDAA